MVEQQTIIIAGSTGLIGSLLIKHALKHNQVEKVVSLSRHPLKQGLGDNNKLIQIVDPEIKIDESLLPLTTPRIGFITLGSTKKKAGNDKALRAIDVSLVVKTAIAMKAAGVSSISIASCIGASTTASSHYLRCKGEMEAEIETIGFEHIVFFQPGPLLGVRTEPRLDERLLQGVMKLLNPIMKGRLLNYKPIEADIVAKAMLHFAFQASSKGHIQRFTSQNIICLSILNH